MFLIFSGNPPVIGLKRHETKQRRFVMSVESSRSRMYSRSVLDLLTFIEMQPARYSVGNGLLISAGGHLSVRR